MTRQVVRVGVVGQGFIARAHCHALQQLRRLDDVALEPTVLCGRDAERARHNAATWGVERATSDWRAVVDAPDVDLVCIFAPNELHHPIAVAAIEAGKAVLCEKPLGRTLAESTDMLRVASKSSRLCACGFNYRYMPAVELARQLIACGELGEIAHFRAHYLQDWGWEAPYGWHHDRRSAGTGAIGDYSHIIDLAHHLVGRIDRVHAETLTARTDRPDATGTTHRVSVEDAYVAAGRFRSGALLSLEASRVATGRKARQWFEINGEGGALWWDMEDLNHLWRYQTCDGGMAGFTKILVTHSTHPLLSRWWPTGHTLGWEHALVHQWAALSRALADAAAAGDPLATFHDGWRADAVIEALNRSARAGHSVSIDDALVELTSVNATPED